MSDSEEISKLRVTNPDHNKSPEQPVSPIHMGHQATIERMNALRKSSESQKRKFSDWHITLFNPIFEGLLLPDDGKAAERVKCANLGIHAYTEEAEAKKLELQLLEEQAKSSGMKPKILECERKKLRSDIRHASEEVFINHRRKTAFEPPNLPPWASE